MFSDDADESEAEPGELTEEPEDGEEIREEEESEEHKEVPRGREEAVELVVANPGKFRTGHSIRSRIAGRLQAFRIVLEAFPRGLESGEHLDLVLKLLPPEKLKEKRWTCNVRVEITASNVDPAACFSMNHLVRLSHACDTFVWEEFMPISDILAESGGWLNERNELCLSGKVTFPLKEESSQTAALADMDFTQEMTQVTFRLSEGPPVFFDKRLLLVSSQYFREMLSEPRWKESHTNEIDLSGNPHANQRTLHGLLRFLLTGSFHSNGDTAYAFSVRQLADQYCLHRLVKKVEKDMEQLLSESNVLSFLGHTLGSGGRLEAACLKMLKENDCQLLELQRPKLRQIIDESPRLAERLMNLLLESASKRRGHKRRREEDQPSRSAPVGPPPPPTTLSAFSAPAGLGLPVSVLPGPPPPTPPTPPPLLFHPAPPPPTSFW